MQCNSRSRHDHRVAKPPCFLEGTLAGTLLVSVSGRRKGGGNFHFSSLRSGLARVVQSHPGGLGIWRGKTSLHGRCKWTVKTSWSRRQAGLGRKKLVWWEGCIAYGSHSGSDTEGVRARESPPRLLAFRGSHGAFTECLSKDASFWMLRAVTSSALRKKNPVIDCLVDTIVWFCYSGKQNMIKSLRGSHYCEVAF